MSKDSIRKNITRKVIILTLFLAIQFSLINSNSGYLTEGNSNLGVKSIFSMAQDPINDTTGPIIVFIQPAENITIIRQYSYNFVVNITDDNPPLFGNVTIQISNQSSFLFNSSMNFDGGKQWSYNWDNISQYPNYEIYKVKIWAKDSSPNKNYNWSEEIYISISISTGPSFIQFLIYIVVVSAIFSLIVVYMNKKARYRTPRKKKKKSQDIDD
ncbi:MAG: hypothetical protein ACFFDY_11320 [Candidatus Thorarchaeota archaeon]